MASEQCTGPVAIWVSVPVVSTSQPSIGGSPSQNPNFVGPIQPQTVITNTPLFFGWGESAPEPELLPEYENIMADIRGSRKPHDKMYEGSDARVTATMTIWNEAVLQAMVAVTKSTSPPGFDSAYDAGTIMHAEKRSFNLWLVFPYSVKSFMVSAGMVAGYHFYGSMLDGPIRRSIGTKVNKVLLSWYCGSVITNGGYICYDFDMTAILGKNPDLNRP